MRPIALSASGGRYVEYLQEEMAEQAYWQGIGCQILELEGEPVTKAHAEALSGGLDPKTGDVLRNRMQDRTLYDLVIHAPKAVSIAGLMDERIAEAHRDCVALVRQRIEGMAAAHTRIGGVDELHWTNNLVQAMYDHRFSRQLDPLLHTHILTLNMTYLPEAGEWRALNALPIYRHGFEVSEDYRQRLAQMLEGWGYELEARFVNAQRYPRDGERYPEEVGFRIKGITPEIEQKFSQRSQKRDEDIKSFKERVGRVPRECEIDRMVANCRPSKKEQVDLTPEEIRERQLERLSQPQKEQLHRVYEQAGERAAKNGIRLRDTGGSESALRVAEWDYLDRDQGMRVRM